MKCNKIYIINTINIGIHELMNAISNIGCISKLGKIVSDLFRSMNEIIIAIAIPMIPPSDLADGE